MISRFLLSLMLASCVFGIATEQDKSYSVDWKYDTLEVHVRRNGRPRTHAYEHALLIQNRTKTNDDNTNSKDIVFSEFPNVIDFVKSGINSGDHVKFDMSYESSHVDWTYNERNDYGVGVAFLYANGDFYNMPQVNDEWYAKYGSVGDIIFKESQRSPSGMNINHHLSLKVPDGVQYMLLTPSPLFGHKEGVHTYMDLVLKGVKLSINVYSLPRIKKFDAYTDGGIPEKDRP